MNRATATPAPTPQIAKVGLQRLRRLHGTDHGKDSSIQIHNVIVVQTGIFRGVDGYSGVDRDVGQMEGSASQMRGERSGGVMMLIAGAKRGTFASARPPAVQAVDVLGAETSEALEPRQRPHEEQNDSMESRMEPDVRNRHPRVEA